MFHTSLKLDEKCHAQPRLCALLTCQDNIMPLAWHMPISKEPFRYAVAVRSENYTHTLLKENKEFALNFLEISYHKAYQICGEVHGQEINKFELSGLHPKSAQSIQTTLIAESYMIYECTLIDIVSYGDHDLFIADVNFIWNQEEKDIKPTLFMGKGYYDTLKGEPIRLEKK